MATFTVHNSVLSALVAKINALNGPRFVSFLYTNAEEETSNYLLNVGVSYENVLKNSLEIVAQRKVTATGIYAEACDKVIASFSKSLMHVQTDTKNPDYTGADTYVSFGANMKIHVNTGEIYVNGLVVRKTVIIKGNERAEVNSRPLTIAQNKMKEGTPASKWRQLKINPANLDSVKIGGSEFEV